MSQTFPGDTPERPRLRPGQPWGAAASGPADLDVAGDDAALGSALAAAAPDPLVRFTPDAGSDLARAVGLATGVAASAGVALPVDAVDVVDPDGGPARWTAVNSVVVGVAPDRLRAWDRPAGLTVEVDGVPVEASRATSLVVVNGQYLRGLDLSPRGHPGDGVAEVQLYALPPGARRAMRARLTTGAHLPHPGIAVRRGRRVSVRAARPVRLEIDGHPAGRVTGLEVILRPAAYRLLV